MLSAVHRCTPVWKDLNFIIFPLEISARFSRVSCSYHFVSGSSSTLCVITVLMHCLKCKNLIYSHKPYLARLNGGIWCYGGVGSFAWCVFFAHLLSRCLVWLWESKLSKRLKITFTFSAGILGLVRFGSGLEHKLTPHLPVSVCQLVWQRNTC